MSTIGFVGLGSMGAPIAGRLLQGHQVYGTNRTQSKATGLIERGLIWLDTPREVAAAAPVVFSRLKTRTPLVLDLPGQAWFDVELMHKDIRLALAAARESRVALPSASVADSMLSTAAELGYGHRDIAAFFEVLGQMAGAPVRAPGPGRHAREDVA